MSGAKAYVGDGVYAELDEFGAITLVTSDGVRDTNTIVLEREVWSALVDMRERALARFASARASKR